TRTTGSRRSATHHVAQSGPGHRGRFLWSSTMSSDYLIRATAHEGLIRAFAIDATGVVDELRRRHSTIPVVTAAIGRLATGALLFGAMLKESDHLVTIRIQG